jgi:hypothetical protein
MSQPHYIPLPLLYAHIVFYSRTLTYDRVTLVYPPLSKIDTLFIYVWKNLSLGSE